MIRYIIGALVGAILMAGSVLAGLAWYLVRKVTTPRSYRRPRHFTFTPWEFGIPYRTVRIPHASDELHAWFLEQPESDSPCILLLPGHGGNKADLLGIAGALYRKGFASLLLDFRGTGQSSGDTITLGHWETEDAIRALDWLFEEVRPRAVGIMGFSLGGSVAIQTAALDDRIAAVVSDSAFDSQYGVLAHQVRRAIRVRPDLVLTAARPMFRRLHSRDYADFAPVELVHQIAPRPLLLIHSDDDRMVPLAHGRRLWERAGEPKELWIPSGVGHCGGYFEDRDGYCRRVSAFFQSALCSRAEKDR